jgi:ParB-like chromosome segregation protein Spo0J
MQEDWMRLNPVSNVIWVPVEKVHANDYNPNNVASSELRLLYVSILHDGYTQPIVTIRDEDNDRWIIVDGFHRYTIIKRYPDIYDRTKGMVPIVVLVDKTPNDLRASTIRHNRARGKHSVDGMSALVISMLNQGWDDQRICRELGLEKEELIRLKHITGYAKFFLNQPYSPAMETTRQIDARHNYERASGKRQ